MRWLFAFGLVLICSTEVRAQASIDGWLRMNDLQLAFEKDHADCVELSRTGLPRVANAPTGKGVQAGLNPVPPVGRQPSFTECMRSKGWVKP